ncbi:hypothetical protein [Streptomyces althioticus]|uniref:hypothetical protein n=1 Tax=Streptomyces althioticus TaxID=83380 RepID=UPI0033F05379
MSLKRLTTTLVVEIDEDEFRDQYNSAPGQVFFWALEHGDAGAEFGSYWTGEVKIEDVEETE